MIGGAVCCLLSALIVISNGVMWTPLRNHVMEQSSYRSSVAEHIAQQQSSKNCDNALSAAQQNPASAEQTMESGGALSTRRRVVLGSVFPDGYGNQLLGIHRLLSIAQCLPDTDVHLPPLVYDKMLPGKREFFTEASDIAVSYYDTERIISDLGVGIVLYGSECRCFDYILSQHDPSPNEVGDVVKPGHWETVYPYRFYKDARYITPHDLELARTDPNALSWKSESCSTSNKFCVFLSHANSLSLVEVAAKGKKLGSCDRQDLLNNIDRARSAVLPSKLVLNAAITALPPRMKLDRLLVVHLRMHAGEAHKGPYMCKREAIICLGRGDQRFPYRKVEIKDFISRMKQLARENDCDHVLPLVPRRFTSDAALKAIVSGLDLEMHDLVSSRGMHPFYTLLIERSIATQAKVYVAEVSKTPLSMSMSETLQYQRRALNMSDIVDLNSTVPSVRIW